MKNIFILKMFLHLISLIILLFNRISPKYSFQIYNSNFTNLSTSRIDIQSNQKNNNQKIINQMLKRNNISKVISSLNNKNLNNSLQLYYHLREKKNNIKIKANENNNITPPEDFLYILIAKLIDNDGYSNTINLLKNFIDIITNSSYLDSFSNFLQYIHDNDEFFNGVKYALSNINLYQRDVEIACNVIRSSPKLMIEILSYFSNNSDGDEAIERANQLKEIIENRDNMTFLKNNIPKVLLKNRGFFNIFIDLLIVFIKEASKNEGYWDTITGTVSKKINNFNIFDNSNISSECLNLLNYSFFGRDNNQVTNNETKTEENFIDLLPMIRDYLIKLFLHSEKAKNIFFSYDNCLTQDMNITNNNINYLNTSLTYVISFIDGTKNNFSELKKSSRFEQYYYVLGSCFPQGYKTKNNITKDFFCEDDDFSEIIKIIFSNFNNMNFAKIESFQMMKTSTKIAIMQKMLELIPLFILIIPIILSIIILIVRPIYIKKKKKISKIDMPLKNEINDKVALNYNLEDDKINMNDLREIKDIGNDNINSSPKWFLFLNQFFNFKSNFQELFNFDFDSNNINNMRGLSYIMGLMGSSLILLTLGFVFLVFMNIPMKSFGLTDFYGLIFNPFYSFIFIGLRYSPRVFFSCSGYILIYKYLSFLDKEEKNYFLKFFFPQIYKYFYFIIILMFERYSLYHLKKDLLYTGPTWEIFNKKILKRPFETSKFLKEVFVPKSLFIDNNKKEENLIVYFWIPINEFAFFIIGTTIISFGYKYKLRIDYFIIFLIIALYIVKIIFYCIWNAKEEIYTTLYYYLFEYGKLMTNPLFNLNYFLIGMYFGLMNFTIQKGINSIKKENLLQNFKNKKNNNFLDEEDEMLNKNKNNNKDLNTTQYINPLDIYNIQDNFEDEEEEEEDTSFNELNKTSEMLLKEKRKKSVSLGALYNQSNSSKLHDNFKFNTKNKDNNNKNKKKIDSNINIIKDNIEIDEIAKEIKQMPFLITPMNIVNFHKNPKYSSFILVSLVLLSLIIIFIIIFHYIFFYKYTSMKPKNQKELEEKYDLKYLITNKILNIFYLLDLEILVFWLQWIFFFIFMKGLNSINDFFSNIHWSIFVKSYFSFFFGMVQIILYLLYESETNIKLDLLNIYLYFFISIIFIIAITIIYYISFELPLKRIFRYIFKRTYINSYEKFIQKENKDVDE